MQDRNGVLAMASGVAATRLKKLHFINWLNQNCESLVWVGGFCLRLRVERNRRGGNSHDLLREFVNSIMNNLFMTLILSVFSRSATLQCRA